MHGNLTPGPPSDQHGDRNLNNSGDRSLKHRLQSILVSMCDYLYTTIALGVVGFQLKDI